jgi:hypothetical protein
VISNLFKNNWEVIGIQIQEEVRMAVVETEAQNTDYCTD